MEEPKATCKRTEIVIPDHQVQCVVVYPDRAEVTREVRLQLDAGENEVVLKSLSKALDKLEREIGRVAWFIYVIAETQYG